MHFVISLTQLSGSCFFPVMANEGFCQTETGSARTGQTEHRVGKPTALTCILINFKFRLYRYKGPEEGGSEMF